MKNPTYKGIKIIHELDIIPLIKKIISRFDPELIIEIGTAHGGLTLVFHESCPSAQVHTFDPVRTISNSPLFGKNVHYHKVDVFKSKKMIELCKSPKKKFLFCDGFDKKKELLTFTPLLNKGDMVGVHDYPSRLWRDWKRGKNIKKMEKVFHPDIIKLLEGMTPLKENAIFDELQKKSGKLNSYGDRYWIK
jgi:hypothetical protein